MTDVRVPEPFGISAAMTTPFRKDLAVDDDRLGERVERALRAGCDSVTLFGTTGEGPSVPEQTRLDALRRLTSAGLDGSRLVLCLHGAAHEDVARQAREALDAGVQRILLPPPCFFGDPSDAGLLDWFAAVISASPESRFIVYHIPQVIGVGLTPELVERLVGAHGDTIYAVKDSSGDFDNAKSLIALGGPQVLIGDERLLAPAVKLGAGGAISGVANFAGNRLRAVVQTGEADLRLNALVDEILQHPVVPAVKSLVATTTSDNAWRRTRPPLRPVTEQETEQLAAALSAAGIT